MTENEDLNRAVRAYDGNYLAGVDFADGQETELKVKGVRAPNTVVAKDKTSIEDPILVFDKTEREMILNKTNYYIIKLLHGPNATDWLGKTVTVGKRYLKNFMGATNVPCLRIIPPTGTKLIKSVNDQMGQKKKY